MKNRYQIGIYHIEKRDFHSRFFIHKFKFALFPNDNAVTSTIINGRQYEPYIFDFLVKNNVNLNGCDVVDVGANNGNFTIDFAMLVGDEGRVFAFEPQRLIYYQLCGNVFMNGLDNVYCHNVALSDKDSTLHIEVPDYHSKMKVNFGDVRVGDKEYLNNKTERITATKLDNYDFKFLKLVKIDVQGFETYVIRGAENTFKKHRPFIVFEIDEDYLNKSLTNKNELLNTLNSFGYEVYPFQKGVLYQTTTGECLDWIGIPKELSSHHFYIP